jgi:hypothetical protein
MADEVSKRSRMTFYKNRLSENDKAEIQFAVKYGTVIDIDALLKPIKTCFKSAAIEKPSAEECKELNHFFRCYVEMVARKYPRFEFDRCPKCRAKLLARRCLGCDIKDGRVSE